MIREDIVEDTKTAIEDIEELNKSLNNLKGYVQGEVRFDVMQVEMTEEHTIQAIASLKDTIDFMKKDYLEDMVLSPPEAVDALGMARNEIKKVGGANTVSIEVKLEDILEKVKNIKDKVDKVYEENS